MLKLTRFMNHPVMGVFGELYLDDQFLGYTVEQPWLDNKPFNSCVPHGRYELKDWKSKKYKDTCCLFNPGLNVYGHQQPDPSSRYACLIHPANWASDVQGCIGIGSTFAVARGLPMVGNSRETTKDVLELIKTLDHKYLTIQWREHIGE